MIPLTTSSMMREIDRKAIEAFGIPGIVLMENAARGTFGAMVRHFPDLWKQRVGIVAGRGNNGGDAFAIGRYLLNRKVDCRIYLLGSMDGIKGDAQRNLEILRALSVSIQEIQTDRDLTRFKEEIGSFHLFIDGIFGTGLNAPVEGMFAEVIDLINRLRRPVVSIDIPSGLHADSGQVLGTCIQASLTATMGLPKRGLVVYPGAKYCGTLVIIDICLPTRLVEESPIQDFWIEGKDLQPLLGPRDPEAHKGDFGHLFVLSGSPGKTGAAAMVCQGALRVGTGLVTLGIPQSLHPILAAKLTEAMTELLPETPAHTLSRSARSKIQELLDRKAALAIGPGISLHPETQDLVRDLVAETSLPMVIDADGLTALVGHLDLLHPKGEKIILTPHPGEMARLMRMTVPEIQANRIEWARRFAIEHRTHLVLKGASSIIASPNGDIFINPTGNPAMATGGMGDILTGMIGGFLAQGYSALQAAQLGVYLHGLAGDFMAFQNGPRGLIATDLLLAIPRLIRSIMVGGVSIEGFSFPWSREALL